MIYDIKIANAINNNCHSNDTKTPTTIMGKHKSPVNFKRGNCIIDPIKKHVTAYTSIYNGNEICHKLYLPKKKASPL